MCNERKIPMLCLKLGVNACLYNGEKKQLSSAPFKKDGTTLLPGDAVALI